MFFLVDCNNFFASCEQIFAPKLKNKPLVILSNNDGCVIARSNEAKKLGIKMGQPFFEIKHFEKQDLLTVFSANFSLYADLSRRVMQTLQLFSDQIEIYSIDEAFLRFDLSDPEKILDRGKEIIFTIEKWIGISISIGIAKTKTLAKAANLLSKKTMQPEILIHEDKIDSFLSKIAVKDIWGIGKKLSKKLQAHHIFTAKQLKQAEDLPMKKLMGSLGLKTIYELRSIPCIDLDNTVTNRKSLITSRSFGKKISSLTDLQQALSTFIVKAATKLRKERLYTQFISVSIYSTSYENSSCLILDYPTCYTPDLITAAKQCLHSIFKPGIEYKKALVFLTDFSTRETFQNTFFETPEKTQKKYKLMQTLDHINTQYKRAPIRFLSEGLDHKWKGKRGKLSPKYTTDWKELLEVN